MTWSRNRSIDSSSKAFAQALGMLRRRGTAVLIGLPPGTFPLSIFNMAMEGTTVRGSIVATRLDLKEALAFAAEGKLRRRSRRRR